MKENFRFTFNDVELQEQFIETINRIGSSVFSNINNKNYVFEVTWVNAKSVVNERGKYKLILKEIENIASRTETYKSRYGSFHFLASMRTIFESSRGSFPRLFNLLKKYIADFNLNEQQYNVVWYGRYKDMAVYN